MKIHEVPEYIAVCPECGTKLNVEVCEWDEETGEATEGGLMVSCDWEDKQLEEAEETGDFDFDDHRHWQSDWQDVVDKVMVWAKVHAKVQL